MRTIVASIGAAVWLLALLIQTGTSALVAIATQLALIALLLLLTTATRTVTVRQILPFFFAGGALMGIAIAGGFALGVVAAPVLEETLRILPVLVLLWRGRRARVLTLGATDVMMVAVVAASGFAVTEDAFLRAHGSWTSLPWLPTTQVVGAHAIAGHAIWGALAGVTLGLATLVRTPRPVAWIVGASGPAVSLLDHVANNYGNHYSGAVATMLRAVTLNGWLTIDLFVAGLAVAIAADAAVAYGTRLRGDEFAWPPSRDLRELWAFARLRRSLAYAAVRIRRAPDGPQDAIKAVTRRLITWPRGATAVLIAVVAILLAKFAAVIATVVHVSLNVAQNVGAGGLIDAGGAAIGAAGSSGGEPIGGAGDAGPSANAGADGSGLPGSKPPDDNFITIDIKDNPIFGTVRVSYTKTSHPNPGRPYIIIHL